MFLICGEALFDIFGAGESAPPFALDAQAGGSPFNVAVGMARLGAGAALFTGLSRDPFGRALRAALAADGVETRFLIESAHRTTLSLAMVGAGGAAAYAFYAETGAERMISPADLPDLPESVAGLHFGSYTMVVEPVAAAHLALAARETGRRLISFDPNVRPNIEPDMEVWRKAAEAMADLADVVKISAEDARLLWPGRPLIETLEWFRARGAAFVIGTKGADGAVALGAFGRVDAPAVRVEVVDTVGAGDAFQAALLAGIAARGFGADGLAGLSAKDAQAMLDLAAKAAAFTCARRGADMPRRAEII